MILTIFNKCLQVQIDTVGAQLKRIISASKTDYLWQGDRTYWHDSAPVLFPFIARLYCSQHRVGNVNYPMKMHGFANAMMFETIFADNTRVLLRLQDTAETRAQYPFSFCLDIEYEVRDDSLCITYRITNTGEPVLSFGIGGHPGFHVPFAPNSDFSDYYLEFGSQCEPNRIGFDKSLLVTNADMPYQLKDNRYIPLKHDIFDDDAIVLKNISRSVSLKCTKSHSYITVDFPNMPYLGIWHTPHTEAPFVCIEPWSSLPGRSDVIEDFACRSDLIHIPSGETYTNSWTITISED